ncbi:MAG: hypothetical protein KGS72_26150 [Cyanobacteria bacterium REEB67]|nr:hypothetical protein [Cyanobacteria bacterium REEB67]
MGLQDAVARMTDANAAPTKSEIIGSTASELLPASEAFAKELYHHPVDSLEHAGKTIVESAAMGAAIGYVLPARGPAALAVAGLFTIPLAYKAYERLNEAEQQGANGKNLKEISKSLAKDTVAGSYDLALNLGGGIAGTEVGVKLATSGTVFGAPGQLAQRMIMTGENMVMAPFAKPAVTAEEAASFNRTGASSPYDISGRNQGATAEARALTTRDGKANPPGNAATDALSAGRAQALEGTIARPTQPIVEKTGLAARLEQHNLLNPKLDRYLDGSQGSQMYFGSLHGHSRYSDGMGLPIDLYKKAIAEGQQVTTITDHNHLAARGGVGPDDPRAADQAKSPIIAASPIEYSQTFADAAATTTPGQHVSLVGTEVGTIGKVGGGGGHADGNGGHPRSGGAEDGNEQGLVGHLDDNHTPGEIHDHDHADFEGNAAHHTHGMMNPESIGEKNPGGKPFDLAFARAESNDANHISGVNHFNLFEVPTFFESTKQAPTGPKAALMRAIGIEPAPVVKTPDVVKINDGDVKAMVDHLDNLTATDGGKPIVQLNHPRYLADENANTPTALRGRDYGQKSFKNQQEWLDRFVTPYVRQVELIKGGALNPNPVDKVPTGNLDPTSFAGYLDKGVHASPTFGRDFHFGDPVGNPGATGIYAKALDKPSVLNALRERRTIATTSSKNLSGVLTGNDQFMMGSILDHSIVPSLNLKMRIDGDVAPDASYTVKLWGDTNLGDGKLASVVQEKTVKGSDLLKDNQTVAFDPVHGVTGQNSAYYVEVQRQAAGASDTDRMWTAPIWLENLAGNKHSLYSKFIAGQFASNLPNPFQSKIGITQ